jgi:hypothetical protein
VTVGTRLTTPELHVIMLDGAEYDVQAFNIDLLAFERERKRHNWDSPTESPISWLNFLAWHALTKTQGILPAMTLREFEEKAAEVGSKQEPEGDDEVAGVDPTSRDREHE